jgi:hypothetical protein
VTCATPSAVSVAAGGEYPDHFLTYRVPGRILGEFVDREKSVRTHTLLSITKLED